MNATRRAPAEPSTGRNDAAVRGALLIGVAVIIGLLLLWRGHDDDSTTVTSEGGTPVATTVATGGTSPDGAPAATNPGETTVPPPTTHVPKDVKVLVANGTGTSGGAGTVTQKLVPKAYFMLPAANAGTSDVERSVIYYREGFEADAAQIARDLGVPEASIAGMLEPMPATPPVSQQAMANAQGAHVLVLLGSDGAIKQT